MIVISLIIVLLSMGIPSYQVFFRENHSKILKEQLLQAIELTRSEAITQGDVTTLKSNDWLRGYKIFLAEKILYEFTSPATKGVIYFRAFPKGRADLQYLPSGLSRSENGTFWYCDENKKALWAIIINKSGRARTEENPKYLYC